MKCIYGNVEFFSPVKIFVQCQHGVASKYADTHLILKYSFVQSEDDLNRVYG